LPPLIPAANFFTRFSVVFLSAELTIFAAIGSSGKYLPVIQIEILLPKR